MSVGAKLLLFWIGTAVIIGVALFVWGWRTGQFRNIEEAKYRMLEDKEPEPWPEKGRGKKRKKDEDRKTSPPGEREENAK
jgi:nitrogen fixation-related uncharacterized protein